MHQVDGEEAGQQEQDAEWFEVMEEIAVGGVPADHFAAPANLDQ